MRLLIQDESTTPDAAPGHPGRRVGGSDVPKLLGISKYGDARDVYDRIVLGLEQDWTKVMERGAAVEPVLRAYAQQALSIELDDRQSDYCACEGYDFAGAQVDDLGRQEGLPLVVEYKSQSEWAKGWGPEGSEDVPEQYRAQVAWQMLCADRDAALVVVGFGKDVPAPEIFQINNIVTYALQRDGVYESHLVQVAKEFWLTHVLPRNPPAIKPLGKRKS